MRKVAIWRQTPAAGWFLIAGVMGLLFVFYTLLFITGVLDRSTLQLELWMLHRPVTGLDCTFYEWHYVGETQVSLLFLLLFGGICVLTGFRWRVVPYLLALLFVGLLIEVVGKQVLHNPLPNMLHSGMDALSCPQLRGAPFSQQLAAFFGIWSGLPLVPVKQVDWLHTVAQTPLTSMHNAEYLRSYPAGHAMRWCLFCLPAAWLCWRRIRLRWLAWLLAIVLSVLAFMGGFMQLYIAAHLLTDTIAGYLLGIALACCAIAVLSLNDKRSTETLESVSSVAVPLGSRD
jgi:PAP2 superfamily.